jgi:hypothetical protein
MAQSRNQLVECRVYTKSTYLFYLRFGVKGYGYALVYFFFGLGNELKGNLLGRLRWVGFGGLTDVNNTCKAYSPTVLTSSL